MLVQGLENLPKGDNSCPDIHAFFEIYVIRLAEGVINVVPMEFRLLIRLDKALEVDSRDWQ